MKCRGKKVREELVKMYDIEPIAHVKLLNGQEKISCTGNPLTDRYYCFSYKKKGKDESLKSFYSGSHASRHFLKLLDKDPLPCFNPLKSISTGKSGGGNKKSSDKSSWNQTMKELYNALNLLIIYWDISPEGAILDIKLKIEKYNYAEPFDSLIKSVNTIISKDSNNYNMKEIINHLNEENDVRRYDFKRVNDRLEKMGIESNF